MLVRSPLLPRENLPYYLLVRDTALVAPPLVKHKAALYDHSSDVEYPPRQTSRTWLLIGTDHRVELSNPRRESLRPSSTSLRASKCDDPQGLRDQIPQAPHPPKDLAIRVAIMEPRCGHARKGALSWLQLRLVLPHRRVDPVGDREGLGKALRGRFAFDRVIGDRDLDIARRPTIQGSAKYSLNEGGIRLRIIAAFFPHLTAKECGVLEPLLEWTKPPLLNLTAVLEGLKALVKARLPMKTQWGEPRCAQSLSDGMPTSLGKGGSAT